MHVLYNGFSHFWILFINLIFLVSLPILINALYLFFLFFFYFLWYTFENIYSRVREENRLYFAGGNVRITLLAVPRVPHILFLPHFDVIIIWFIVTTGQSYFQLPKQEDLNHITCASLNEVVCSNVLFHGTDQSKYHYFVQHQQSWLHVFLLSRTLLN